MNWIEGAGETIVVGGRKFEVAYTPGHASHHVTYFDQADGVAFTGDTAGMRPAEGPCVLPVTPPPDIDVEGWRASLAVIRDHRPQKLFVTHFGPSEKVAWHLENLRERLERWSTAVDASLAVDAEDADRAGTFARGVLADITRFLPREGFGRMAQTEALEQSWYGLARYWRKKRGTA